MWLFFSLGCLAQSTPKPVSNWQTELIQRYTDLHKRTLRLAAEHRWPYRKNYSNRRQLTLQEVDVFGQPIYYTIHNTEAAQGTRTQALYRGGSLQLSLSGSSSVLNGRLGLWDGGRVLATHQEFTGTVAGSAIVQQSDKATLFNNHTTHLAGTLIARGINPAAKGMAFGANLSVWDYTDDLTEIAAAAPNLILSNHAYGPVVGWVYNPSRPGTDPNLKWEWWGTTSMSITEDYLFGFYTTKARDLDRIAFNNPFYLMVRSADNKRAETGPPAGTAYFLRNTTDKSTIARSRNDAYDVIPAEANAKNVLTVGAADLTLNQQNQPTAVNTTAFSGWGPTDDGRIKPDLLGIGTDIISTLADNTSAYGTFSGTSMASANVTGSLVLLQELYAQQRAITTSTTSPASGQFMRAATLRGLVLHTADRTSPGNGPDYRQGWGLLNTEAAARVILNTNQAHLMLEKTLESGSTFTQHIAAQGNEPLVITLCWTDPEGVATSVVPGSVNSRTPKLVNDLDVRLSDGNTTSLPFVLDPSNPAKSATTGDNIRDNIEQVYIQNPAPGQTYTLSVAHKGKLTYGAQPFSVIMSGLRRASCNFTVTVAPSVDTTICRGGSLLLSSPAQTGFTYQWLQNGMAISGSSDPVYRVTQAGSYALRLTDNTGCSATSHPVQVQFKAASVTITPASDQWLCQNGEPVRLMANGSIGASIEWLHNGVALTNAQSTTLSTTESGSYQVRLTEPGCQSLSNAVLVRTTTVDSIPLKPDESDLTLLKGAAVTIYAPSQTDYRYQWYRDNKLMANATTSQLSVSEPGAYKVQITQQTCVGWSPERIVHLPSVVTSVAPEADSLFTAYPNPADQAITVQYAYPNTKAVQVSVLDIRGRIQQQPISLTATNGQFEGVLNVGELSTGLYFLRFSDGDRVRVSRFLKK